MHFIGNAYLANAQYNLPTYHITHVIVSLWVPLFCHLHPQCTKSLMFYGNSPLKFFYRSHSLLIIRLYDTFNTCHKSSHSTDVGLVYQLSGLCSHQFRYHQLLENYDGEQMAHQSHIETYSKNCTSLPPPPFIPIQFLTT